MDPRFVNEALKREHYEMLRKEDIEAELAGTRFFSMLDANAGFHQIPLDEETSRICTFSTPLGRYHFKRLPFRISSAPKVFQKTMTQIFEGLPGVRVCIDDVLIWFATREEHDARLQRVIQAAQDGGVTLNAEKCQFCVTEVTFLGDMVSKGGIQPDPQLVNSVLDMPAPRTKKECNV